MTVLLALLLDRLFGEPPTRLHPVVWMGAYLGRVGRWIVTLPPRQAFVAGALGWLGGAVLVVVPAAGAAWALGQAPAWVAVPVGALLLKPLFALRLLLDEVTGVEAALAEGLDAGRARLSRIVSRDTATLSAGEVRESALESLSENLSDSLVAPLFWFVLLGLPGAALYRFANTADAMWGYRGRWEWAGKWAARADDLLNLVPARLTAIALLGLPGRERVAALLREARRTASPNSGWPMAALALALGIRMGKPGVYLLNADAPSPGAAQMRQGLARAGRAGVALALLAGLAELAHG
ncbi:Cobalamin biosynthesis protein CobD [Rhodovastum atsumiense]|uniref:Cobalamin biosynthesis protein CobD n=1 Tax=Rhodovastum atsumiense TaxID=504468 RepID=A0A5M6IX01_9PROT|nr:adenosylcobinamide-phosphate synthase CbiB [Rhodovastum atsumiense]KAA5612822.1 cobalamin biosynthesis protein CobD [Rhodovastum atsumiense]CAH2601113.1 Cobalamin biosynthesis protein CobD [Rhodovastum atsumiense]